MLEKFQARDRRFIVVCLAIAVVCGAIALRYFGRAFPEASIHFAVNRTQSGDVARDFLAKAGESAAGFNHATVFDFDEQTKTYLERQLGLERAQEVYGKQVRLWRWSHRWFKPQQKEELRVDVTAGGEVARFAHLLPEDAPGATVEPESARAIAEHFLGTRMGVELGGWDFVEGSSSQQPHRVDHSFTWKKHDLDLGDPDATYRITVDIAGDRVAGYDEHLEIPQTWQDDYSRLRARNDTAALVATVFLILTLLAMTGSLVLRIRDRDVRWRTVTGFGLVAFVLQLASALNQFDLEKFQYETQNSYPSFVTQFALQAVFGALALGGLIVLLTAAAEPIYRERHPDKLALPSYFTWRGLRTKSFFEQVLLGLTLMFFFAAYQSIFYVLAAKFGAWAPLEVPYSNMLNTAFPWALVLFIGFFPAVSEEFISRMFSIPFLDKHLSRFAIPRRLAATGAVFLASYIWGFAHSNYPNQPFWIRGVEVGTAGVVVSLVFWRWGILATLVWHYTVDAFYTSLLMLRSGNAYLTISGAITAGLMLVPLAVTLVMYRRCRGFEPADGLLNRDLTVLRPAVARQESEPEQAHAPYVPVARRHIIGALAVAGALLLLFFVPVEQPGDGIRVESSRAQALHAARGHLHRLGADPDRWRVAVQVASRFDPGVGRYIVQHTSVAHLNQVFTTRLRTPVWRVRFFRPDEREEWLINLPVNEIAGDSIPLWAFEHVLPDSAAGDTLGLDAAQLLASDFLRARGVEPADLDLKESKSERQKARTDHSFEWEVPDSTLEGAGARYRVIVRGGEVAGLRPYMHLPEAWVRAYEEKSVLQRLLWMLSIGLVSLAVVALVVVFVQQILARRFALRPAVVCGAVTGLVSLLLFAMRWQSDSLWEYDASLPYHLFIAGMAVRAVVLFMGSGIAGALLFGTLVAVRPHVRSLFAGRHDERYVRDAVGLAAIGVLLQFGVRRFGIVLDAITPHYAKIADLLSLPSAAGALPWLDVFCNLARNTFLLLPAFALVLYAAGRLLGVRRALGLVGVAVVVLAGESARSMGEFGAQLLSGLVAAGVLVFVVCVLFRGNDLAYVFSFLAGRGIGAAALWLRQPAPEAQSSGVVLAALACATLMIVYVLAARGSYRGSGSQPSSAARSSATDG